MFNIDFVRYKKKTRLYGALPLDMQITKYNEVKAAADLAGESVNGYIKVAIDRRLVSDKPDD